MRSCADKHPNSRLTDLYGGPEGSNTNKKETANKKKKTQIKKGKRK